MAQPPGTQAPLHRGGPVRAPLRLAGSAASPWRTCLCGSRGARCPSGEQSPYPRHPPAPRLLDEGDGDQQLLGPDTRGGPEGIRRLRTRRVMTPGRALRIGAIAGILAGVRLRV